MSLWKINIEALILNKNNSLQEHKIIKKTLNDSLITPNIPNDSKGASCFGLLSGSLTVEAAFVLPLFLFAMINILSLFLMFESYGAQLAKLHQTGRQLAVLSYLQGTDQEQDIELVTARRIEPLIGIMGYQGSLVVNGCVMHKWIGYDLAGEAVSGEQTEEMVFVTERGSVFHSSRGCTYLNPAVESVTVAQASERRNENGRKYTPCQTCGGQGELVYITGDGERYHTSISCGGLKRKVNCITRTAALTMGKHACTRCGT